MNTSTLKRHIRLIGGMALLSMIIAACGQPQSTDTAINSPVASIQPTMAETMTAAPIATTLPTAMPTAMPTDVPTTIVEASPAASGMNHDHMDMGASPAAAGGAEVAATIKLFSFSPEPLEVVVGTTVVWTNEDDIEHSVTSGTAPTASGAFDSDFFTKGQTYTFTFTEPGEFSYFCKRHPSMIGLVKVGS